MLTALSGQLGRGFGGLAWAVVVGEDLRDGFVGFRHVTNYYVPSIIVVRRVELGSCNVFRLEHVNADQALTADSYLVAGCGLVRTLDNAYWLVLVGRGGRKILGRSTCGQVLTLVNCNGRGQFRPLRDIRRA